VWDLEERDFTPINMVHILEQTKTPSFARPVKMLMDAGESLCDSEMSHDIMDHCNYNPSVYGNPYMVCMISSLR
jgi:hypothetical protein